ncbi:alpha/beta fold hydrolase [Streptomyces sp. NPDC058701]|uniref:alpha/beta fold hydrolase n=1 Tax=Streptomyces sp. NPDC058701 TaxID=3346608 RepID=UPI00364C6769
MAACSLPPRRLGTTALPDGRQLGWAEWGPEDGRPMLLCPGAAASRTVGLGTVELDSLGVRLVSVDRPGLGASTASPLRTPPDFATDIGELAARRGWRELGIVGCSQGAPFALACAAAGLAGAVALVAPVNEVARPETARLLSRQVHQLAELAALRPQEAEAFFAGFTPAAMRELILRNSPPCDRAVYQDPAFSAAHSRALALGFVQGSGGYARDTLLAMRSWGRDLSAITAPVDVWHGSEDRGHSPDPGELLTTRIPGAERRVVPGAGGSLLWTHACLILQRLLARSVRDGC